MNPQASDVSKVDYGAKVSESEEFDLDSLLEEINNLEEKDEAEDVKEYGGFVGLIVLVILMSFFTNK